MGNLWYPCVDYIILTMYTTKDILASSVYIERYLVGGAPPPLSCLRRGLRGVLPSRWNVTQIIALQVYFMDCGCKRKIIQSYPIKLAALIGLTWIKAVITGMVPFYAMLYPCGLADEKERMQALSLISPPTLNAFIHRISLCPFHTTHC